MNKTGIIAYWPCKNKYEIYSSLKGFVEHNPTYNYHTLASYVSRKKEPYYSKDLILTRSKIIGRKELTKL